MKQNHHNAYRVCTVLAGVLLTLLIGMPGAFVNAAEVLLVPDDYPTIQEAVDAANADGGDTIFIGPGEFAGAVIFKPVKIIGSGNETKITSGTWLFDEHAIDIGFHNETEIRDLMIDGDDLMIDGDDLVLGIYVHKANNVTIANVTVNNSFIGSYFEYSDGLTIFESTFNNSVYGVRPYFSDGLTIVDSTFNNSDLGVFSYFSDGLAIADSTFNNSYRAIDIWNGSDCEVMHNRVLGLMTRNKDNGLVSHSDGIALIQTNDCVVAHNYVWHTGEPVGGYVEEFYVGIALASGGEPTEGNNFHHNRVEVSVDWGDEGPVLGAEWSGAQTFSDYGVVDYDLPISIKNNKLMHNNFLGSDQGEHFYPGEVENYNFAKFNLFDE